MAASPAHVDPKATAATAGLAAASRNFLRDKIVKDLGPGGRCADRASAKGDIIRTRFPPEPNGYLHIGHAKSICLNFGLAKEFHGRCHLRFDDTNPAAEKQEYIDAIQADIKWLGFDWGEHQYYASSYFDQLYEWAVHLVKNGDAYVDSQSKEDMSKNRGTLFTPGVNSPYRERSVEENLKLFEEMKQAKHKEGTHILRAKIDMAHSNMNMRDPPLYRIRHIEHPRTGNKWVIYPIYDFAHGQEDAIEGITHSFCTLEFEQHRPLYEWFLDHLPIETRPVQTEFAKLKISGLVMSKRNLLCCVNEKIVSGWDDPRMPTICGLRRRGIPPEAVRMFCEKIGVTKNASIVDIANLEDVIRETLDNTTPRRFACIDPIKVVLEDYPDGKVETFELPNHPKVEMGSRSMRFSKVFYIDQSDFMEEAPESYFRLKPGGEAMLRTCQMIVKVKSFKKDANGKVTELVCTHEAAGTRKVPGHIGWVSADDCVEAVVNIYNNLFKEEAAQAEAEAEAEAEGAGEDKIDAFEAEDEKHRQAAELEARRKKILESVNPDSLVKCRAVVEANLKDAKPESRFQFERIGYFVVDRYSTGSPLVFNRTITLRASGPEKDTGRSRKAEQEEQLRLKKILESKPPQEMFRIQTDKYSQFDADGVPTHDAAGAELSKGAAKKLRAQWEKQKKKLGL
eukprot:gene15868-24245_t